MKPRIAALAVLALAFSVKATVVETLGVGTPSTACNYTGPCTAPVLAADGTLDGSITVHASTQSIERYDIAGNLLWKSTDYVQSTGAFSFVRADGSVGNGTLFYTGASKLVRCGGSGRWIQYCNYHWISGGSLTE